MKRHSVISKWISLLFALVCLCLAYMSSFNSNVVSTLIYVVFLLVFVVVFIVMECREAIKVEVIKYQQDGYMCSTRCPYKTDYKFVGAYACRQCDSHVFQDGDRREVGCKFKYLHR